MDIELLGKYLAQEAMDNTKKDDVDINYGKLRVVAE